MDKYNEELFEVIKEAAEKCDWGVHEYDNEIEFESWSPMGENYVFSVSKDNIVDELQEYYNNYDPDEHAEEWVEARAHGVQGVPSIRDLLNDADAIDKMLENLTIEVCNAIHDFELEQEEKFESLNDKLNAANDIINNKSTTDKASKEPEYDER